MRRFGYVVAVLFLFIGPHLGHIAAATGVPSQDVPGYWVTYYDRWVPIRATCSDNGGTATPAPMEQCLLAWANKYVVAGTPSTVEHWSGWIQAAPFTCYPMMGNAEWGAPCVENFLVGNLGGIIFKLEVEQIVCPPGDFVQDKSHPGWCIAMGKSLAITASPPVIPGPSRVRTSDHHVLTMSVMKLLLTQDGKPDANDSVALQSDRGAKDEIVGPALTDSNGIAHAMVWTHEQPGTSTITSATGNVTTDPSGVINWLPATYEDPFLITCYGVANQKHQTGGPMVKIPGLPGTYHQQFFSQIVRQGSGVISDTTKAKRYIQRVWIDPASGKRYKVKDAHYGFFKCPYTHRGDCATAGNSIAVDYTIIPMQNGKHHVYANVSISDLGDRTSEDGGQWVGGYHIDVFWGRTWADYQACLQWGRNGPTKSPHTVTFKNYVH